MPKKLTVDMDAAHKLLAGGMTIKAAAETVGVSLNTLRGRLNPKVAEKERQRQILNKVRQSAPHPYSHVAEREPGFRPVPADTRSVTGRLFGDPLPGRSALDQRSAH